MATYYVSTTGNNANPGTQAQPWLTVAFAATTMVAGDTTYVRGGVYNEGLIRFGRTGTSGARISLLNYPGESPIIDFIDKTVFQRILFQLTAGDEFAIGWFIIDGFEIRDGYDGIRCHNLHDSIIRRCWIHDCVNQGIGGNGARNLIDRCTFNHNGAFITDPTSTLQHGIYVYGQYWTITNNLIYDNLTFGIQQAGAYPYNPATHPSPEFGGAQNWVIVNNTIAYEVNRAGITLWSSLCSDTRIENNLFFQNGQMLVSGNIQGIELTSSSTTGIVIRNNLFYATTPGATLAIGGNAVEGVNYTQSGNIINASNPNFVNGPATIPASPDFHLLTGSPAINAGLTQAAITTDFDGNVRPQGVSFDIGAYEFVSGAPPAAPTGLRVI